MESTCVDGGEKKCHGKGHGEPDSVLTSLTSSADATAATQQKLRSVMSTTMTKLDKVIESSIDLSKEMKRLEMESLAISSLESWVLNTSSALAHLKNQSHFLHRVLEDTRKKASEEKETARAMLKASRKAAATNPDGSGASKIVLSET